MNKPLMYAAMIGNLLIAVTGCNTVNEAVRQPSAAIGTVASVPQAITQGVTDGYVTQTGKSTPNPYNR